MGGGGVDSLQILLYLFRPEIVEGFERFEGLVHVFFGDCVESTAPVQKPPGPSSPHRASRKIEYWGTQQPLPVVMFE